MADDSDLDVWVQGALAGVLHRDGADLTFTYDQAYRQARGPALSVSMPKSRATHEAPVAGRWIDNLLPDNDDVRERWAAGFGERRATAFNLLRHMGADCAGAVQIMPLGVPPETEEGGAHVDETEIEQRLRALRRDDTAWTFGDHGGRWSLGGAQGKFALAQRADGTWEEPTGRAASTHIFKVGIGRFAHGDVAEYATMRAAQLVGLQVAHTELKRFGDETAMVSRRFDRQRDDGQVRRLHQEDLCQALGLSRALKYQSDGGPSIESIGAMLRSAIDPRDLKASRELFAQAIIFNWLTAGTDAHAKNYALLHFGSRVRLAPLYDLTSAAMLLPVKEIEFEARLAMKMGGEYKLRSIGVRHLARASSAVGVEPDWMLDTATRLVRELPGAVSQALDEVRSILDADIAQNFVAGIDTRLRSARSALDDGSLRNAEGSAGTAASPATGTWVEPHTRNGRAVAGHWRKRPG